MKKLMIAFAAVAMAAAANAACVDWAYTGVADDVGYTLYVFSTAVQNKYDSFAAFSAGALSSGVVYAKKVGPKTKYLIDTTTIDSEQIVKSGEGATTTLYFALIEDSDAKTYTHGSISTVGMIYEGTDPSPGYLDITDGLLTYSGKIEQEEPTPEPTSGLLMLLGMAGLALRRKQK